MEVQRYHLFPQLGFVLVLVGVSRPLLARFDARPRSALLVAMVLASLLLVAHRPMMRLRARAYRFPDQARTLKALERAGGSLPRASHHTRTGPGRTRPDPDPLVSPRFQCTDDACDFGPDARASRTTRSDRHCWPPFRCPSARHSAAGWPPHPTCGRRAHRRRPTPWPSAGSSAALGDCQIGPGDRFLARGPAHLEFQMSDPANQGSIANARMLCVPGFDPEGKLEVWWTGEGARWSETRSVRWQPVSEGPTGQWAIPLESLPHWSPSRAGRIRVVVRSVGTVALEAPRLLRSRTICQATACASR